MKLLAVCALTICALAPACAATHIGVSIGVHQPGAYGRIDINNYPSPELVYAQPIVISPAPMAMYQQPIYLYVPVAHQQNWKHYCGRYRACGQRVYFVQDQWVRERYQQEHGQDRRQARSRPQRPELGNPEHQGKHDRGNAGHRNEH
jgi:hypothetical protein